MKPGDVSSCVYADKSGYFWWDVLVFLTRCKDSLNIIFPWTEPRICQTSATFMFAATLSNKLKQTHPRWCFPWSILWRSEKQVMKFNINGLKHRPTHTGAVRFVCFVRWIEPLCSLTAQKRKGSSDKVNKERKLCKVWLWAESGQLSHRCDGATTHCVLCCWLTTCY